MATAFSRARLDIELREHEPTLSPPQMILLSEPTTMTKARLRAKVASCGRRVVEAEVGEDGVLHDRDLKLRGDTDDLASVSAGQAGRVVAGPSQVEQPRGRASTDPRR